MARSVRLLSLLDTRHDLESRCWGILLCCLGLKTVTGVLASSEGRSVAWLLVVTIFKFHLISYLTPASDRSKRAVPVAVPVSAPVPCRRSYLVYSFDLGELTTGVLQQQDHCKSQVQVFVAQALQSEGSVPANMVSSYSFCHVSLARLKGSYAYHCSAVLKVQNQ